MPGGGCEHDRALGAGVSRDPAMARTQAAGREEADRASSAARTREEDEDGLLTCRRALARLPELLPRRRRPLGPASGVTSGRVGRARRKRPRSGPALRAARLPSNAHGGAGPPGELYLGLRLLCCGSAVVGALEPLS